MRRAVCKTQPAFLIPRGCELVGCWYPQVAVLNHCRALDLKFLALLVDHARHLRRLEIYGKSGSTSLSTGRGQLRWTSSSLSDLTLPPPCGASPYRFIRYMRVEEKGNGPMGEEIGRNTRTVFAHPTLVAVFLPCALSIMGLRDSPHKTHVSINQEVSQLVKAGAPFRFVVTRRFNSVSSYFYILTDTTI